MERQASSMSKRLTAIASSGAEKARIEWGTLDYGKALPPMQLDPKREYKPLRDPRMRETRWSGLRSCASMGACMSDVARMTGWRHVALMCCA